MSNNIYSILFLKYEWSIADCYDFLKENKFLSLEYIDNGAFHQFIIKRIEMRIRTELITLTKSVFMIINKVED